MLCVLNDKKCVFTACRVNRQIVLVGLGFSEANQMLVISLGDGFVHVTMGASRASS